MAYVARKGSSLHVVHDGSIGMPVASVDQIAISPDGRRIAYSAQLGGKWRMVIDDKEGVNSDEVGDPAFSPDGQHIAYTAKIGKQWHMVVDAKMNAGRPGYNGKPVFSGDSKKIAYLETVDDKGTLRLVVSDLEFKRQSIKKTSGNKIVANADKTKIAAITVSNNNQRVSQFSFDQPDAVEEGPLYDAISHPAFGMDGVSVTYVAERGGKRFLVLSGKEERLPDGNLAGALVVRSDNKGVGVIMGSKDGAFLHQAFLHNSGKEKHYEEAADLVYNKDGSQHAYAARTGNNWFVVVNGKEGPVFDRVVTPVFSPDGKLLVYRARKDGKRFVVIADVTGTVIRRHPSYEMVFPVVFTDEGKSVAYGVKDGRKLIWKVEKL